MIGPLAPLPNLPDLPDLTGGAVEMPTLTRDELAVLGDRPVLHDAIDETTWAALDTDSRQAVRDAVLRGLVARDLVRPAAEGLMLSDAVRLMLGVRAEPSFLVVGDEVGNEVRQPLRGYGIDLLEHRTDAVLLEFAADGLHRCLLTTPGDAAVRLASWALEPRDGVEVVPRTLEVLQPGDGRPGYRRGIVLAAHGAARLAPLDPDGVPGEPEPIDADGLADWLERAWSSAPEAGPGLPVGPVSSDVTDG